MNLHAPLFPTRGGASSKVVWLYKYGYLDHIDASLRERLSQRYSVDPYDNRGLARSFFFSCSSERSVLRLAKSVIESFSDVFDDDPDLYDHYHLAESLFGLRSIPKFPFDGEIFLENSRFDYHMRGVERPFVAGLYNLINSNIDPYIGYSQLVHNITNLCLEKGPLLLSDARVYLLEAGIKCSESILNSIILNEPSFIFLKGQQKCFGLSRSLFKVWDLMTDLIPDDEYIKSSGLKWGYFNHFSQVRFELNLDSVKRFLVFQSF